MKNDNSTNTKNEQPSSEEVLALVFMFLLLFLLN